MNKSTAKEVRTMNLIRKLALCMCLILAATVLAAAEDKDTKAKQEKTASEQEAKEMSGMSIVGNDEAPKSLYIVPWKSSEIGVETSLNTLLNEGDVPVDREVFKRQLDFYLVSTAQ
jgi:hypothetical protein